MPQKVLRMFKVAIARALIARPIAGCVCRITRRQVSMKGVKYDLSNERLPPSTIASVFWRLHESAEIRMVRKYVQEGDVVVELGGCIGIVSAQLGARVGRFGRLTVVEPNIETTEVIERNLRTTSCGSVNVLNAAVGRGERIRYLASPDLVGGSTTHATIAPPSAREIGTIRLGDIDPEATVLVMDIEGAEWSLLDDELESFEQFDLLIAEIHRDGSRFVDEFCSGLADRNWRLVERAGPVVVCKRG